MRMRNLSHDTPPNGPAPGTLAAFASTFGPSGGVELPFGAIKRSGYGREIGPEGLCRLGQIKTVVTGP